MFWEIKMNQKLVEDKEKSVVWAVLLCILAVVLIVFGYYADKEEKSAMHSLSNSEATIIMEVPKNVNRPTLSPEFPGITKNV